MEHVRASLHLAQVTALEVHLPYIIDTLGSSKEVTK